MPIDPKPIRSLLFVPGNREDWMRDAPKYGSDGLIFDMEGALPPDQIAEGREIIRRVLDETGGTGSAADRARVGRGLREEPRRP